MDGSGVVVMLQQQQRHRGLCSFATPVRVNISTPFLCCPFNESVLCRLKQYNNTPHDHICLPSTHSQQQTTQRRIDTYQSPMDIQDKTFCDYILMRAQRSYITTKKATHHPPTSSSYPPYTTLFLIISRCRVIMLSRSSLVVTVHYPCYCYYYYYY